MTNPIKGEVPVRLSDGRELTLVLDMEALVAAEAAYGKPMSKLMADALEGFMGALGALMQGALARHQPRMTRGEALSLLTSDEGVVTEALGRAAEVAFPEVKGGNVVAPPDGKNSGSSGSRRGSNRKASGE